MGVLEIIMAIDAAIGLALRLEDVAKQLAGTTPVPTIDEILAKQKKLKESIEQAKQE